MKLFLSLALFFIFCATSWSCSENGSSGFLPSNNLYIPVGFKSSGGLTKDQFNSVIDKVEEIYSPIVFTMGLPLKIERNWENGTVDAKATKIGGPKVRMFGGLARHSTITEDGFALVICHEIGHHIGGAPKVGTFDPWASNEGQSDYFATLKCLRKVFLNDNNLAVIKKLKAPKALIDACAAAWTSNIDKSICIRSGLAGASVASLIASLKGQPESKFETPDMKVVSVTYGEHPDTQCRLDTFFQGALCEASFNDDVSQNDEVEGTCHKSLGHTIGLRPLCWFKPKKQ
jgi:hypothetical protein